MRKSGIGEKDMYEDCKIMKEQMGLRWGSGISSGALHACHGDGQVDR